MPKHNSKILTGFKATRQTNMTVSELYKAVKTTDIGDVSEFSHVIHCLYALGMIDYDEEREFSAMLKEIQCAEFKSNGIPRPAIRFYSGLNTVQGSDSGTNSIGKSTFLMIVDFVFRVRTMLKSPLTC